MTDINLTLAQRNALRSLQVTQQLSARTQVRLASGRRVNSVADDAVDFFKSKQLSDTAEDFGVYKNGIEQGITQVELTLDALDKIDNLLKQIKGVFESSRQQTQQERGLATGRLNQLGRQIRELVNDATYLGSNFVSSTNSALSIRFSPRTDSQLTLGGFNLANKAVTIQNVNYALFSFNVFSGGIGDGTGINTSRRALTADLDPTRLALDTSFEAQNKLDAQRLVRHSIALATSYYEFLFDATGMGSAAGMPPTSDEITAPVAGTAPAGALAMDDTLSAQDFYDVYGGVMLSNTFNAMDASQRPASSQYVILRMARNFIDSTAVGDTPDYINDDDRFGAFAATAAQARAFGLSGGIQTSESKQYALDLIDTYIGEYSYNKDTMQQLVAFEADNLEEALEQAGADVDADGTLAGNVSAGFNSALIQALERISGQRLTSDSGGNPLSVDIRQQPIIKRIQALSPTQLLRLKRETNGLEQSLSETDQRLVVALDRYAAAKRGLEASSTYFQATAGLITAYSLEAVGANSANIRLIDRAVERTDKAIARLRGHAGLIGAQLSVLETRLNFTTSVIRQHQIGSDRLVLADLNEEGANLVALQTRQQLGIQALAISGQQQRAVVSLLQSA